MTKLSKGLTLVGGGVPAAAILSGHVGIVADPKKGLMIVAPCTGDKVKVQSYKNYPGGPAGFTRPLDRPDIQRKIARMAR